MDEAVIRVFLVEADDLTLAGLRLALDRACDLEPAGEAASIDEATSRLPPARWVPA